MQLLEQRVDVLLRGGVALELLLELLQVPQGLAILSLVILAVGVREAVGAELVAIPEAAAIGRRTGT